MRTKKAYLVIVILLLGSLAGNRVCAQFTPGDRLSELKWPYTTNFDFEHGNKGFVRLVGADTPKDQCCYSIFTGTLQEERFRVSANGTGIYYSSLYIYRWHSLGGSVKFSYG